MDSFFESQEMGGKIMEFVEVLYVKVLGSKRAWPLSVSNARYKKRFENAYTMRHKNWPRGRFFVAKVSVDYGGCSLAWLEYRALTKAEIELVSKGKCIFKECK